MPSTTHDAEFFRNWNRHRRNYFIKLTLIVCTVCVAILVILIGSFDYLVILISLLLVLSTVFLLAVYLVISNPPKRSSPEEQKVQNAPTM
jgi:hypothetical protein